MFRASNSLHCENETLASLISVLFYHSRGPLYIQFFKNMKITTKLVSENENGTCRVPFMSEPQMPQGQKGRNIQIG